ncbi:hypothetical protein H8M03_08215 [Sphingomonas sabuli]|uniref:Peptidase family M49 n=1 Tax=Sphingomonas sabuli TaxID=2764186 RepID=A0A7G9L068_9SPHN|nr:hypothetical protein [Sphingomonas sabuli]QNM82017.1 hypothetical protein H8M03_08215 [Sphingomonas sabuli]
MTKARLIAAASLLALSACATTAPPVAVEPAPLPADHNGPPVKPPPFPVEPVTHETAGWAKLAPVQMTADTSYLSSEERQVVNLLNQAANLMSEIYFRQVFAQNPQVRTEIDFVNPPGEAQVLEKFDAFFGPWDPLDEDKPFFGNTPRPDGAGFYPPDMTKTAFDAYLAANPDQKDALTSGYTVVRRDGDRLVAVPYSVEYKQWLEPAAALLEQAAAITTNASLKRFLTLRAQSFRTDDYYESELAWMDLKDTPIEIAIGPYETYTDKLYGRKTAFEAFVTLRNPQESAKLDKYKSLLRDMEANLPVEEKYKNFKRGFESPISVVDQVHGGGDNVPGVQTIAFNLPNDERVREAKGAKKVILQNVLGAKYERILKPMAALVLVPEQAGNVTKAYMANETLFHELAHSLGPGSITVNGRATTVDKELKEIGSGFEEAKADVMGAYNIMYMMDRGVLPKAERPQIEATYIAGLFRAMRFGVGEAHGRGAAMQYRYMRDHGGIAWDPAARRYRVDPAKLDAAIKSLVADIVRLQGNGDYAGTKAFLDKWAVIDPEAQSVIDSMTHIPVDIRPIYPDRI